MNEPVEFAMDDVDDVDVDALFDSAIDLDDVDDWDDKRARKSKDAAWRRVERRAESAWLRDQMADWDDWKD